MCRTFAKNLRGAKVRHDFHLSSSFHDNRTFFRGEDAKQVSIRCLAYSALEAVRARWFIACPNFEPTFRSLRLIRPNLRPIYQRPSVTVMLSDVNR